MTTQRVIASDATKNSFEEDRPNGLSLVSVAVAVEDITGFEDKYFETVRGAVEEYNIKTQYPLIKDKYISRWVVDWKREAARREIVMTLLETDCLDTIQITETYLKPQWIDLYAKSPSTNRRETANKFVDDILSSYYEIVSIWKYLETYEGGSNTHYNIMTDDFTGQRSSAWEDIGRWADEFIAVPQGDRTYPILSFADLLLGLLKQEVYPLRAGEIREYLEDLTPAYVNSDSVYQGDELRSIIPHDTGGIRTELHYPDPTVYIERGNMSPRKVKSLDSFDHACMYAHANNGCVKFFEESTDRHHLSAGDLIVCLNNNVDGLDDYEKFNDIKSANMVSVDEAVEIFRDDISSGLSMQS